MSEQLPPPGAGNPFDEGGRTTRDPRAVKALLAGVAGVAVIGGGALGFVWLGSTPGADASALAGTGGAISTPSVTTSPATTGDSAFAANGRDIFAATVAPTTESSTVDGSGSTSGAGVSNSSGSSNSVITFGSGSKSSTGTKAPTNGSASSTTSPTTSSTTQPAPSSSATPTAEVTWTAPNIRFVGASADSAGFWIRDEPTTVARGAAIGNTSTVFDSYATVATTVIEEDINGVKTEKPSTDGYAVLRSGQGLLQGWMLKNPSGSEIVAVDLPDAAVGNTKGSIKVYEVGNYGPINGSGARISVNGAAPVYVKAKGQIPGTDFTYAPDAATKAFATTSISKTRGDFAVLADSTGRIYFGLIGAGEDAGVSY